MVANVLHEAIKNSAISLDEQVFQQLVLLLGEQSLDDLVEVSTKHRQHLGIIDFNELVHELIK